MALTNWKVCAGSEKDPDPIGSVSSFGEKLPSAEDGCRAHSEGGARGGHRAEVCRWVRVEFATYTEWV